MLKHHTLRLTVAAIGSLFFTSNTGWSQNAQVVVGGNSNIRDTITANALNVSGQTQFDSIHVLSRIKIGNSITIGSQPAIPGPDQISATSHQIDFVDTNLHIISQPASRLGDPYFAGIRLDYQEPFFDPPVNGCGSVGSAIWDMQAKGRVLSGTSISTLQFSTPSLSYPVMVLTGSGKVGIGCTNPQYKLDINGTVRAQEFRVNLQGCDFVLEDGFTLQELKERKRETLKQKHLKHLFPAKGEVEISMNALLQGLWQNTEEHELYLYNHEERIEILEKENLQLKTQMTQQQKEINEMKKEMEELKKK